MARELSRAEQEFIQNYYEEMSVEELCEDMVGVGPKTVQDFIDSMNIDVTEPLSETDKEIVEKQKKKFGAGRFLGRDKSGRAVVLTQPAAEIADEHFKGHRKPLKEMAKERKDHIFIMDGSKEVK